MAQCAHGRCGNKCAHGGLRQIIKTENSFATLLDNYLNLDT